MAVNHPQLGIFCEICFTGLTMNDCAVDANGNRWDTCKGECARQAGIVEAGILERDQSELQLRPVGGSPGGSTEGPGAGYSDTCEADQQQSQGEVGGMEELSETAFEEDWRNNDNVYPILPPDPAESWWSAGSLIGAGLLVLGACFTIGVILMRFIDR